MEDKKVFLCNTETGALSWYPRFEPEADAKPVLSLEGKRVIEELQAGS